MNTDKNPFPFYQLEGDIWTNFKPDWSKNRINCSNSCCYSNTLYQGTHYFQHRLEPSLTGLSDILAVELRYVNDNAVVSGVTINYDIVQDTSNTKYLLINIDIDSALIGDEYYVSTTTNNVKYYSEVFCVANQTNKKIGITWSAKCKVGNMVYTNGFKHIINLDARIVPAESELEEEFQEDGLGNETPVYQKLIQPYFFSCVVPNFIAQALSALPLHNFFNVFNYNAGEPYTNDFDDNITKVEVTLTPEADGCNTFVQVKYTQETIIKTGCCEELVGLLTMYNIQDVAEECLYGGSAKTFEVNGSADQTIKVRIDILTKVGRNYGISIRNLDTNNLVWSASVNQVSGVDVNLPLDNTGHGNFKLEICFSDCSSSGISDTELELTLYNADGTTLSGSSFTMEATATCTDNIAAVDDFAQVENGQFKNISPMANDTINSNTIIVAVSNPTNGTANIIGNGTGIQYTHNGSSTTSDSFTYTISDGLSNSTATVFIDIEETVVLTAFITSEYGGDDGIDHIICAADLNKTRYFSGNGTISVGDYVYTTNSLNNVFNGNNKLFKITGNRLIEIDSSGKIVRFKNC